MTQENWSYQRSLVCDFTPFYFQGARVQFYPTKKFKTELWVNERLADLRYVQ